MTPPPDRAGPRPRLQALAGATVHGSDDRTVGRVRDVYVHDATGELAALTVMPRQLSARSVLIPASAIAALPELPVVDAAEVPAAPSAESPDPSDPSGARRDPAAPSAATPPPDAPRSTDSGGDRIVHLLVDTPTAKAGARPPHTLHATPQVLREAAAALRLEEGSAAPGQGPARTSEKGSARA